MTLRSWFERIPRRWRTPLTIRLLFSFEMAVTIPALALYGIAQPDLYRTQFWQEGFDHGWNSSPDQLIYAYANYKPIKAPLPWRSYTTYYNVIISVVSLFSLLLKVIAFMCGILHPLLSLVWHCALAAIYAVAIYNQAAPDMSDPKHPQPGAPWYIAKSCGPPVSKSLKGYCQQAKGAFALTVILTALFTIQIGLALFSLWPTKSFRDDRRAKMTDQEARHQPWEMLEAPRTPGTTGGLKSPTTPRTKAFNILSSKGNRPKVPQRPAEVPEKQGNARLTLKHHVAMDDSEAFQGPSAR